MIILDVFCVFPPDFPHIFYLFIAQIEEMCRNTRASAVPVVPDSEGNA